MIFTGYLCLFLDENGKPLRNQPLSSTGAMEIWPTKRRANVQAKVFRDAGLKVRVVSITLQTDPA